MRQRGNLSSSPASRRGSSNEDDRIRRTETVLGSQRSRRIGNPLGGTIRAVNDESIDVPARRKLNGNAPGPASLRARHRSGFRVPIVEVTDDRNVGSVRRDKHELDDARIRRGERGPWGNGVRPPGRIMTAPIDIEMSEKNADA